jgi:hypothetical protein
MKYIPTTVAANDRGPAKRATIGGEVELWATAKLAEKIGELECLANAGAGGGTWTADPTHTLADTPKDLAIKVDGELTAETAAVVTVVGIGADDILLSGTATLQPPAWVKNQSFDFAEGNAWDITASRVVGGPGSAEVKFKSISAVSITNAKRGSKLSIYSLPEHADWQFIEMVNSVAPAIGIQPAIAIPDRLNGTAEVKRGRSEEKRVSVNANHKSAADGLMRFNGRDACFMAIIRKGGKIMVERNVFVNGVMAANPDFGEGNTVATQAAEGLIADAFMFVAQ